MKMCKLTWYKAILVLLIFFQHQLVALINAIDLTPARQKATLFQFKQSLKISTPKTINWSLSSDHCTWDGVSCDKSTGSIIGLDLSCSQLEGAILPNSTLFQLSHLQFLNLSQNDFSLSGQFPQEFGFFAKGLLHLNLSKTQFQGRVPSGISRLYKLVSLDLSDNRGAKLEDEVFSSLLQNLAQLRVLNLEYVNILSVLHANLSTSLTVLNLQSTGLRGVVPEEVFHLPNLELLDLSLNENLTVTFPKVKWGSSASLRHLDLGWANIKGGIPDSIGFLESLTTLDLSECNLSGMIPSSIGNLGQLTYLGLSGNNFQGAIPAVLGSLTNLRELLLSFNNFTGPLPSWISNLRELNKLSLGSNSLNGPLHPWLFDHPSLELLRLSNNRFTGQMYEFDSSRSHLQYFSCKNNFLSGSITRSFSQLVNLTHLDLSSNNFSGVLHMKMFLHLQYLRTLDLSYNNLIVRSTGMTALPQLFHLGLSSCKLKEFPQYLRDTKNIYHLDLSNNHIDREIPHWVAWYSVSYLNLSHNRLTGGLEQLPWSTIQYLDLQSNMLNGSLPSSICNSSLLQILNLSRNNLSGVLPICQTNFSSLLVFDLRINNIRGNIPATLSNFRYLETINLNGNQLEGRIPSSFAEFDFLQVLDLGNNQMNGTFPQCLEALPNLQVLVLKSNKFHGVIKKSSKIEHPFPSLRIIDLSYNEFSGPLPAIYLRNFKAMMNGEVNKIERSYMERQYYSDSTSLVIKGVDVVLERILTIFTTIDLSRNNFEGEIAEYIGSLVSLRFLNLSHNHLTGHIPSSVGKLRVLEALDLSVNQLVGKIPQQLSGIYTLALLNLSCNQLGGHIPEGSQFDTFEDDSYAGNWGLCGHPLTKKCENAIRVQEDEDADYFFSGFTWEAVVIGYGCGVVPAFITGYLLLLAGKPKWFAGIIARELGLKIMRMEIKTR